MKVPFALTSGGMEIIMILNFIRGFCMALADSVPGVSGGTVAFLLGFYDSFISSLNGLISKDKKIRRESIIFLLKLGVGWIVGMVLAVLVLTRLFESHIYKVSSLFLGFVIFSIPLVIYAERGILKDNLRKIYFVLIGAAAVVAITYFNPVSGGGAGVNISGFNPMLCLYIAFCGMIAISAMVLPGISGSTLLLIFGLYMPIINGVKEILHLNLSYLPSLCAFAIGVFIGVISIVKVIKICLEKFRSQTIFCIIGLMIGSLYAIVMGPETLENAQPAMGIDSFSIIYFAAGGIVVIGLQKIKQIFS